MNCHLLPPKEADVVLDTDAYNEIDDLYAIAYLLYAEPRLHAKAIYAAPFFNSRSVSAEDGMEKSYHEIKKIMQLAGREVPVLRGSVRFLPSETEAVSSDAAEDLARRAMEYTPEQPLYVLAIGAITNVASALIAHPLIRDRIVVVWLGGNALTAPHNREFNMYQDVAAGRVVMGCGVRMVQLPCLGVVSKLTVTRPEVREWVGGTPLTDYLRDVTLQLMDERLKGKYDTKVIWDVTTVAWLMNDDERFMTSETIPAPIPEYSDTWGFDDSRHPICYVNQIRRSAILEHLFETLNRGALFDGSAQE